MFQFQCSASGVLIISSTSWFLWRTIVALTYHLLRGSINWKMFWVRPRVCFLEYVPVCIFFRWRHWSTTMRHAVIILFWMIFSTTTRLFRIIFGIRTSCTTGCDAWCWRITTIRRFPGANTGRREWSKVNSARASTWARRCRWRRTSKVTRILTWGNAYITQPMITAMVSSRFLKKVIIDRLTFTLGYLYILISIHFLYF